MQCKTVKQHHKRINLKRMFVLHMGKTHPKRINPVGQQPIAAPLRQVYGEKPSLQGMFKSAVFRHGLSL